MIDTLNIETSTKDRKQAIGYAQDLVRLSPKRPSAHASVGWVYFRSWMVSKTQYDANKAITGYRKYLQLAPKKDNFRKQAERIIKEIQQGQTRQKKN